MLTGLGTLIVRCILHVFLALGLQNVTFFRGFKFFHFDTWARCRCCVVCWFSYI